MLELDVRAIGAADYEAVTALWRRCEGLAQAEPRDGFERFLARNPGLSPLAVERGSGALAGAALCGHDGRRGYVYHLGVAPEHRRRGVGTALARRCLEGLSAEGIARCTLFVYGTNRDGLAFWRQGGWLYRNDLVVLQHAIDSSPVCAPG